MGKSLLGHLRDWLGRTAWGAMQYEYRKQMRQRSRLDDEAFFGQFYAGTGIDKDIPLRVRHMFESFIGEDRSVIRPNDNLFILDEDLDGIWLRNPGTLPMLSLDRAVSAGRMLPCPEWRES